MREKAKVGGSQSHVMMAMGAERRETMNEQKPRRAKETGPKTRLHRGKDGQDSQSVVDCRDA